MYTLNELSEKTHKELDVILKEQFDKKIDGTKDVKVKYILEHQLDGTAEEVEPTPVPEPVKEDPAPEEKPVAEPDPTIMRVLEERRRASQLRNSNATTTLLEQELAKRRGQRVVAKLSLEEILKMRRKKFGR